MIQLAEKRDSGSICSYVNCALKKINVPIYCSWNVSDPFNSRHEQLGSPRNTPSKTYALSLTCTEKSLYGSTETWVRIGVVLPHHGLCLREVRERPDREFYFPFVFGGACSHTANATFLQRTSGCSCACQHEHVFHGALKKHFVFKKENNEHFFFFSKEQKRILRWDTFIWLFYFHSKRKPKNL